MDKKEKIKVLLVDDHQIILEGITVLLNLDSNISVVGTALNGADAIEFLKHEKVDVVILDINMPIMNGLEATKLIRKNYPKTKIIILTMCNDRQYILKAMETGANGYLFKGTTKNSLISGIHTVFAGNSFYSINVLNRLTKLNFDSDRKFDTITNREREILTLIGECMTTHEISAELHISRATVETHIRSLLKKLNAKTRMKLVRIAVENKYIKK